MEELTPVGITVSAGNITGIGGTLGTVDNAVPRADGVGGFTVQGSDIVIDDATTSTQNNVALTNQHSGQTNSALVLTPKGTGALIAGPKPDGAASGGNARGTYAVDLQLQRNAAVQVASGSNSATLGGARNTASGSYSVSFGGLQNSVAGNGSAVIAGNHIGLTGASSASGDCSGVFCSRSSTASVDHSSIVGGLDASANRYAMQAHSAGAFSAQGDAQRARFVMRGKTTTNAAVELFLNGSATRLTIPSGKVLGLTINITGIKSDGSAVAHYLRQYCLKNVSGTCTEVYAPVTIGTDNAAGTSIALSAYDVGAVEALKVEVTGITSEIWRWVASVDAVEIAYGI
jgi:hypothetical protein